MHTSDVNSQLHSVTSFAPALQSGLARGVLPRGTIHMRSSFTVSVFPALVAFALLLAAMAGCKVDAPPSYADREKLRVEQVEATKGVMFGVSPLSFESSVGKISVEPLEIDHGSVFSRTFSRVVRLTLAGSQPADVTCVHDPVGAAYPPGFEFAQSGSFACRGTIDKAPFTLAVDRGCYQGVMTLADAERYTVKHGKITIAGAEVPSGEVSIVDAQGTLVSAFDLVTSMTFRVWSGESAQVKPSRATLIVAAAAIHDWKEYASAAKLDACN
jgi:hypothetical protein